MSKREYRNRLSVSALGTCLALASCAQTAPETAPASEVFFQSNTDVSRVTLYDSLSEIKADSDLTMTGLVLSSREVEEFNGTDLTLFQVAVDSIYGSSSSGIEPGDVVIVRQFGTPRGGQPATLLNEGEEYLLFLTLSGLDDERADQYYVTGSNAGIYREDAGERSDIERVFTQVDPTDGENLPSTVKLSDLD